MVAIVNPLGSRRKWRLAKSEPIASRNKERKKKTPVTVETSRKIYEANCILPVRIAVCPQWMIYRVLLGCRILSYWRHPRRCNLYPQSPRKAVGCSGRQGSRAPTGRSCHFATCTQTWTPFRGWCSFSCWPLPPSCELLDSIFERGSSDCYFPQQVPHFLGPLKLSSTTPTASAWPGRWRKDAKTAPLLKPFAKFQIVWNSWHLCKTRPLSPVNASFMSWFEKKRTQSRSFSPRLYNGQQTTKPRGEMRMSEHRTTVVDWDSCEGPAAGNDQMRWIASGSQLTTPRCARAASFYAWCHPPTFYFQGFSTFIQTTWKGTFPFLFNINYMYRSPLSKWEWCILFLFS